MSLFDLQDEVAVVIGGTGVLGGAMAEGLAAHGARVAVAGRNAERGQARAAAIEAAGQQARFVACDATQPESLRQVRSQVEADWGPVTVLINAAGGNQPQVTVGPDQPFERLAGPAWVDNFNLNLIGGIVLPCQEFGPAMVERGRGSIINIASVAGHVPLSGVVSYAAAKAAVLSLSQFLAREWGEQGVRVNTITPGFFPAEQNRRLLFEEDGSPTARARQILSHTPMDRFGRPEELVGAAVFLASAKASSFMTGADVRVDGGFLGMTI